MTRTEATRGAPSPSPTEADLALARLREMSIDLRGCALLRGDGEVLAASGDPEGWKGPAASFLAAADAAAGEPASHVHVATEDGEAFAIRDGELALLAVTERFALASLMLSDMRAVLRDLLRGEAGRDRRAPDPAAQRDEGTGSEAALDEEPPA